MNLSHPRHRAPHDRDECETLLLSCRYVQQDVVTVIDTLLVLALSEIVFSSILQIVH